MTWVDATRSDTTARNASRFIQMKPVDDASGGVDFSLVFTAINPFVLTAADPVVLTDTPQNDPT